MNLSWRPLSQSSPVRCSMTPPAAEPALLTMMSTRPSALWPCSTKFLASLSCRRSAGMAMILRPVVLAISPAAASSGSLRRAHIAISTPSFAKASAIPLPMPSLPPVISAVLPLSLRSIALSQFLMWFVREPAARLSVGKQFGQRRIEFFRFLARERVTGARNDHQTGGRHRAAQENAGVDAPVILVADNNEQRHGESLQIRFHVPQRRPLGLQIDHGQRVTMRRMFAEDLHEFGITARILVLMGLTRRAVGVTRCGGPDVSRGKHLAGLSRCRAGILHDLLVRARSVAAACGRHRNAALRMSDADVQRRKRAHRMADDVRFVDLERIHHGDDVFVEAILAVFVRVVWNIRWRIAALAVGDAAVRPRETPHLRLPGAVVCRIFMHEDDRRALPCLLVVEPRPVSRGDMRHHALHSLASNYLHTNESGVKSHSPLSKPTRKIAARKMQGGTSWPRCLDGDLLPYSRARRH